MAARAQRQAAVGGGRGVVDVPTSAPGASWCGLGIQLRQSASDTQEGCRHIPWWRPCVSYDEHNAIPVGGWGRLIDHRVSALGLVKCYSSCRNANTRCIG
jgi:hypothetical protein